MRNASRIVFIVMMLAGALVVRAGDAKTADVGGKWTWDQTFKDGGTVTVVLTLKQDGENITGTFHGRGPDSDITDGSFRERKLEFNVEREIEGHKIKIHYVGKVDGDVVKGEAIAKILFREKSEPWEAKREKSQ